MRFGIRDKSPHTLEEAGKAFGITRERVPPNEAIALDKLQHNLGLRHFVPAFHKKYLSREIEPV